MVCKHGCKGNWRSKLTKLDISENELAKLLMAIHLSWSGHLDSCVLVPWKANLDSFKLGSDHIP